MLDAMALCSRGLSCSDSVGQMIWVKAHQQVQSFLRFALVLTQAQTSFLVSFIMAGVLSVLLTIPFFPLFMSVTCSFMFSLSFMGTNNKGGKQLSNHWLADSAPTANASKSTSTCSKITASFGTATSTGPTYTRDFIMRFEKKCTQFPKNLPGSIMQKPRYSSEFIKQFQQKCVKLPAGVPHPILAIYTYSPDFILSFQDKYGKMPSKMPNLLKQWRYSHSFLMEFQETCVQSPPGMGDFVFVLNKQAFKDFHMRKPRKSRRT